MSELTSDEAALWTTTIYFTSGSVQHVKGMIITEILRDSLGAFTAVRWKTAKGVLFHRLNVDNVDSILSTRDSLE